MGFLDKLLGRSRTYHEIPRGDGDFAAAIATKEWNDAKATAEQIRPQINRRIYGLRDGRKVRDYARRLDGKNLVYTLKVVQKEASVDVEFSGIPRLGDVLGEMYGAAGYDVDTRQVTSTSTVSITTITPRA